MRSFYAFLKKEFLESLRTGKLLILGMLFLLFGIMNPAIAKLTPWLLEAFSDSLAETGMSITPVTVNALTSWTQFFKNIPMALIVFVLIYANSFTKEYDSGSLVLILSRGFSRYKVVLAKSTLMLTLWTLGYWMCFFITYAYNEYFWDNSTASDLYAATVDWWLFGVFTICLTVFFSAVFKSFSAVALSTGGVLLVSYLVGMIPKLRYSMPTSLLASSSMLFGGSTASDYLPAVITTGALSLLCLCLSIPILNKKQL